MSMEKNSGYAPANDLEMYYEERGVGEPDETPIIALHGAYMTADSMEGIVSELAKSRKVYAVELQGHGRTGDVDRPLSYEGMADDVAAFLESIGVEKTDVLGFSMGAGIALQLAIRHPEKVRKVVVASGSYSHGGMHSELTQMVPSITPEMFAGSPMEEEYRRLAPNPDDFPKLVEKLKQLDMTDFEWDVSGIVAPVFIIVGDSDAVRLEHIVEMFRKLGGGVMGDLAGMPERARLAVLPATSHFMPPGSGVMDRVAWFAPMIEDFLALPMPEENPDEVSGL